MTLALRSFSGASAQHASTPLARFDPRWKLLALLTLVVATSLLHGIAPAAVALLLGIAFVAIGRIGWRWYLQRLAGLVLLLAFFVSWLPWLVPGETLDLPCLHPSVPGLWLAVLIVLKTLALVTFMLALLSSASGEATFKAAHALRVPGLLVQLVALSYRYVFLLGEELGRIRIALRVRGFRNRPNLHSYRTVGHVTGALLIRSYERAERVAQAMRCRGFDGRFRSLAEFRTRPLDVLAFLAIVLSAAGLLVWDHLAR